MLKNLNEKLNLSEKTKIILLILLLIIFVAISFYLFLTYIYEFFLFQIYCYALMKSDSPKKAAWYTLFILVAYLILKFSFLRVNVVI